ncbi:MAG: mercury methylation corrinoid protein HgcA [bacterium]|nr:mercury methylation corrinoid protein HgcA [bacterium]
MEETINKKYIIGFMDTEAGKIPKVPTALNIVDKWGTFRVRWSFNRMGYTVTPGIYAVGNPNRDSLVLVSANYKLSFDVLRQAIKGMDAYIMVIDTNGINVWCAAGKGTFGTSEIVNRIEITELKKLVNHWNIILPQLGAPGVSAYEVKRLSGFSVIYGPIRAVDIKAFINAGMKASKKMRQVRFSIYDRLLLVPMEIMSGLKYILWAAFITVLLSGFSKTVYSTTTAVIAGAHSVLILILAYLSGTIFGPLLLPWLPGRSFSFKGGILGLLLFAILCVTGFIGKNLIESIAWLFLIPAINSFIVMNFTGASTYTSLSGVRKEMRIAVPLQVIFAFIGIVLYVISRFI